MPAGPQSHWARTLGNHCRVFLRNPRGYLKQNARPHVVREFIAKAGRLFYVWVAGVLAFVAGLVTDFFGLDIPGWGRGLLWAGVGVGFLVAPLVAFAKVCRERDSLRAVGGATADPEGLLTIAAKLRCLPGERDISHNHLLMDTTTLGGKLLLQAVAKGAFSSNEDIDLLEVMRMSASGEYFYQKSQEQRSYQQDQAQSITPPPAWHVFVNARRWCLRRQTEHHDDYGRADVEDGCPMFADMIESEARRLSG